MCPVDIASSPTELLCVGLLYLSVISAVGLVVAIYNIFSLVMVKSREACLETLLSSALWSIHRAEAVQLQSTRVLHSPFETNEGH